MIHVRHVDGVPRSIATEYSPLASAERRWRAFLANPGEPACKAFAETEFGAIDALLTEVSLAPSPPEKVALQISVEPTLAAEIRLFMVKEQVDSAIAREAHERVILFLQQLAPQIDSAAGYSRQIKQGLQRSVSKAGA